ncbi:MAG: ExbD/TolR family protein [Cetobacterium sp.]
MKRKTKRRNLATPDLTPLIDVVFLLLIFFMLVTTFDKYSGFKIELPKSTIESKATENISELIIDSEEKYYKKIGDKSELILKEEISIKFINIKEVTLTADKNLKYDIVVNAIGELKKIEVEKVELNFNE